VQRNIVETHFMLQGLAQRSKMEKDSKVVDLDQWFSTWGLQPLWRPNAVFEEVASDFDKI